MLGRYWMWKVGPDKLAIVDDERAPRALLVPSALSNESHSDPEQLLDKSLPNREERILPRAWEGWRPRDDPPNVVKIPFDHVTLSALAAIAADWLANVDLTGPAVAARLFPSAYGIIGAHPHVSVNLFFSHTEWGHNVAPAGRPYSRYIPDVRLDTSSWAFERLTPLRRENWEAPQRGYSGQLESYDGFYRLTYSVSVVNLAGWYKRREEHINPITARSPQFLAAQDSYPRLLSDFAITARCWFDLLDLNGPFKEDDYPLFQTVSDNAPTNVRLRLSYFARVEGASRPSSRMFGGSTTYTVGQYVSQVLNPLEELGDALPQLSGTLQTADGVYTLAWSLLFDQDWGRGPRWVQDYQSAVTCFTTRRPGSVSGSNDPGQAEARVDEPDEVGRSSADDHSLNQRGTSAHLFAGVSRASRAKANLI
ncbi:MAG: hypothetical protein M1837_003372 [Sclerophora amabilis]|nr:MAG: hypothetical protein M1837_003372 [Sclerophora amabilis]